MQKIILSSLAILLMADAIIGQVSPEPDFCNENLQPRRIFTIGKRVYIFVDSQLWDNQGSAGNMYTWFMANNTFKSTADRHEVLFPVQAGYPQYDEYGGALMPRTVRQSIRCFELAWDNYTDIRFENVPNENDLLLILHHQDIENTPLAYSYWVFDWDRWNASSSLYSPHPSDYIALPGSDLRFYHGRYQGALIDPVTCNRYFLMTIKNLTTQRDEQHLVYTQHPYDFYNTSLSAVEWQQVLVPNAIRNADYVQRFDSLFYIHQRVFAWARDRTFVYEFIHSIRKFQKVRLTVWELFCQEFSNGQQIAMTDVTTEAGINPRWLIVGSYIFINTLVLVLVVVIWVWICTDDDADN